MSHPSWVCGLKHCLVVFLVNLILVTPFVGVWIETPENSYSLVIGRSHPSWVCGLKHAQLEENIVRAAVTPFVGVWIETLRTSPTSTYLRRHTLRGCVD